MWRLGIPQYINTYPLCSALWLSPLHNQFSLQRAVPTTVNQWLKNNEIDCGLISAASCLQQKHSRLSSFGIAAKEAISSVTLYFKESIPSLHQAKVGLTSHSSSSISLLKVLCHHFWKVSPTFSILPSSYRPNDYEGFLLIGDEALLRPSFPGFKSLDLATAWWKATNLPFVFAVFATAQSLSIEKQQEFENCLQQSYTWGQQNLDQVIVKASSESPFTQDILRHYYTLCRYKLGEEEEKGLQLFSNLLNTLSQEQ